MQVIERVVYDDFGLPQESEPLNITLDPQSAEVQVWMENETSNGDPSIETRARSI